jgi:hypothetical protein
VKIDLRNRKLVLTGLAVIAVVLFAAGMVAAYQSRHDTICPDGKPPIAQRSGVIGQIEYLCHGGKTVTK